MEMPVERGTIAIRIEKGQDLSYEKPSGRIRNGVFEFGAFILRRREGWGEKKNPPSFF